MSDPATNFHQEMLSTYHESVKAGYKPTLFFQMVNTDGGVATAHKLLAGENVADGFTNLWQLNRLDLAVESLVLKPEYVTLFSDEERARARHRLEDANYTPPWLATATQPPSNTSGASTDRFVWQPGDTTIISPTTTEDSAAQAEPAPSLVERLSRAVDTIQTTHGTNDEEEDADETPAHDTSIDGVTGVEAGLSGQEQIKITLQAIVDHGGSARIRQIYTAVEAHMNGNHLSAIGKSSLRYFINSVAVNAGYLHPYDRTNPGWHITQQGHDFLGLPSVEQHKALTTFLEDTHQPPDPLDGRAFVISVSQTKTSTLQGNAYRFSTYTIGERARLSAALDRFQNDGTPVYLLIYRPQPHHAFTAWARVTGVHEEPGEKNNETYWIADLDLHPFPRPLNLKQQAAELTSQISWLANGWTGAFHGYTIREITAHDLQVIQAAVEKDKDMTMADAAFAVLSRAGGGPLRLNNILEQAQEQGLIHSQSQTPSLSLSSVMLRDERFVNLGRNTWILAPSAERDEDSEPAIAVTPPVVQDTGLWRIHFPRELWAEAYANRVVGIGFLDNPTNQSVQRFRQINVGDRVVVYIQSGVIGGVGVVTRAYRDEDETGPDSARLFGGKYPKQIGVAWSDKPTEQVDILAELRQSRYTNLYNRIKNPHTVMPLSQEDYTTILELIGGVDPGNARSETRLPGAWSSLSVYRDFILLLDDRGYGGEELLSVAHEFDDSVNATTDAADLIDDLRQLRLLRSTSDDLYQPWAYVNGTEAALLRLMTLALLAPVEGSAEIYTLPARQIIGRGRDTVEPQPLDAFAPQLGADRLQLLQWYAEAGFVVITNDTWRWADDAFRSLSGDDAATTMYNTFLATLLADIDGTLPIDMAHASGPLTPVTDVKTRLNELGSELLIDPAIVQRIHRSLVAGRHIVLSGPPGTGKTELARRLPTLLWRESAQQFTRLSLDLDALPVETHTVQRKGYLPIVVTATEDWGVRDVVGGIGPRLDGDKGALSYDIQYGVLTRVLLLHYDGTDTGRRLPAQLQAITRRDYLHSDKERYRGAWLVIDEFTRAPIDAAFGSLLTTLSGGGQAQLAVPTGSGPEVNLPLPEDFRIIGTLNSFDRHFLNQMSEALKRRFDFIDVLPPPPTYADFERGIAGQQALRRLQANGFTQITVAGDPPSFRWGDILTVTPVTDQEGMQRTELRGIDPEAEAAITSFWRLFSAIRVFRQLGTAQAVAVYTNLFAGALVGMSWKIALDTALADSLADQLQVMGRDEQRVVDAYVEHAGNEAAFVRAFRAILSDLPPSRRPAVLHTLREANQLRAGTSDITLDEKQLSDAQIARIFDPGESLALPTPSVFRKRLRDLIGERGL